MAEEKHINGLESRISEAEKNTAAITAQVHQISNLLSDIGAQLNKSREASERGFREIRNEIRQEIDTVRQPKGAWTQQATVVIALLGLLGGPMLVYSTFTQETQARLEARQYANAMEQTHNSAVLIERQFWLDSEFQSIKDESAASASRAEADRRMLQRRDAAVEEHEMLEANYERLRELVLNGRSSVDGSK